jgi:FAD/FMN-containing dehydrogenase
MSSETMPSNELLEQLQAAIGREYVLTSEADREFFAMDVYNFRELPFAVVQPGTIDELQQITRIANLAGMALVPRGGGASYTDAYLPDTPDSLLIDTTRLDRIVEINAVDMYVTVEAGVTWAKMTEALAAQGLRTPFWGPFSGLAATVGGSMSQNAVTLGSGTYGISADSVLSFEIVLADGEILRTGSRPIPHGTPFFRWYGPDLTGLFTGDAGALGIKARITLRLIRQPAHIGTASFGFTGFEAMAAGMSEAAREGAAADNYGLDPKLQQGQLGGTSAADALGAVWAVLKTSRNPLDGLVRVLKMALAGKRFIKGFDYSAHYVVEGASRAEIRARLAQVRKAMAGHGTEIANTIPTVLRAAPFIPLYPILGPKGERWACMHGIMPFSKVAELHRKIERLFAENADDMQRHRVHMGGMFTTISTHAFLYEPVFYWEDDRTSFHKRYLPEEYLATLPEYDANPEGRALVRKLREGIIDCFASVGAIHLQIGKCYPYTVGRDPQALQVLTDVKRSLDPDGRMNPGALGLSGS